MAGDWIKMRVGLFEHPKVIAMADSMNARWEERRERQQSFAPPTPAKGPYCEDLMVGKLNRLWGWLGSISTNGRAVNVTTAFIDRHLNCEGFCAALRSVGWLIGEEKALTFPRFDAHNGSTAKRRASETLRKQVERVRGTVSAKRPQSVRKMSAKCPQNVRKNADQRREEKSREDKIEEEETKTEPPHRARRPTVEEVLAHAKTLVPPAEEKFAKWWWDDAESVGWIDNKGRVIRDWKRAFSAAWSSHQHNNHERTARIKRYAHENPNNADARRAAERAREFPEPEIAIPRLA